MINSHSYIVLVLVSSISTHLLFYYNNNCYWN